MGVSGVVVDLDLSSHREVEGESESESESEGEGEGEGDLPRRAATRAAHPPPVGSRK